MTTVVIRASLRNSHINELLGGSGFYVHGRAKVIKSHVDALRVSVNGYYCSVILF